MKNAMQLKAIIKNIAKKKKISAQLVLQNYMLERFLERVSLSSYRDNFIIKGGFLIASMVGLDSRATMDMDATIKGYPVNAETIQKMIEEILIIPIDDNISFEFRSIGEIREGDEYTGYRVALTANYEKMAVPLKLDITTGDKITPKEIEYDYKLMLEDRSINVLAYNLPTILAEKLETVISRGDQNTRPRDYYDIFTLKKLQYETIDLDILKEALRATAEKRSSIDVLKQYREIMQVVSSSPVMNQHWNDYRKDFDYAAGIEFSETCDVVIAIMDQLTELSK
ncbi:MAG: nucleotidyl transferase AbiEii/AbiGii toxin family protein [Flexilinea sp.]|nr:nucleotidyl transferase AbiEii/AbiGii toxin family protein [Flexilinea sp.]